MRSATASPSALAWYSAPRRRNGRYSSGAEHDHHESRLQAEVAADEAHARGHRHQRHAERRGQLEHRSRQEADPQRLHRGRPVALADRGEDRDLVAGTPERAQRGQAPDHVEEVAREPPERQPALARALLGVATDQPHEHGHERQREQHDQRRFPVDHRDPGDHEERHHRGEHGLGQIAGEVALERVDALHGDGGDLGPAGAVRRDRLRAQPLGDERQPELGQDAPGGTPASDLHARGERTAQGECDQEQREIRPQTVKRDAVERSRDDPRQHGRLEQHRQSGTDPERDVEREQGPRRPGATQQARIEGAQRCSLAR